MKKYIALFCACLVCLSISAYAYAETPQNKNVDAKNTTVTLPVNTTTKTQTTTKKVTTTKKPTTTKKIVKKPKIKQVVNLKVDSSNNKSTTLKWKKISAKGYQIYRSKSKNKGYKLIGKSNKNTYKDKKIKEGTTYYYKVRAFKVVDKKTYYGKFSSKIKVKKLAALKKKIKSKVSKYSGEWGIYVKDLKTGDMFVINDKSYCSASVIKLFTMESIYNRINKGKLKESNKIQSLLRQMITVSSNEAYNELVRYHSSSHSFNSGLQVANKYLHSQGYKKTYVNNTLHPSSSPSQGTGKYNLVGLKDCGKILERIYNGESVSKKHSKKMLSLLKAQTFDYKIPASLPKGIKVANKTGENSYAQHDVGIVYGKKTTYVVCILSQFFSSEYSAIQNIKSVSKDIYKYLNS